MYAEVPQTRKVMKKESERGSFYVCNHVCIYACMHVCTYACMYACMHVSMYVSMYACMYVCMYLCMYLCMHVCMYVCMYVCMPYACLFACSYVCMLVCLYVCMHRHRDRNMCILSVWTMVWATWHHMTLFLRCELQSLAGTKTAVDQIDHQLRVGI